ncbi:hypothetical protein COO60DRAFT_1601282, partial [Scenedesmus sp. NREL 46B-D3]
MRKAPCCVVAVVCVCALLLLLLLTHTALYKAADIQRVGMRRAGVLVRLCLARPHLLQLQQWYSVSKPGCAALLAGSNFRCVALHRWWLRTEALHTVAKWCSLPRHVLVPLHSLCSSVAAESSDVFGSSKVRGGT